ncbi:hypothetical protein [Nocardia sp. NBC_01327]|uniref:hypothetical protein n=1 Tax=Nocardia sp. NBC_01327 TaxID=2903593 RepID=UPI002E111312|nr:hypothetical protein OG326_33060 [Nocardia sp. NBC_01327]
MLTEMRCGICRETVWTSHPWPENWTARGTTTGWLCFSCIERVKAAGPWQIRRAAAVSARHDALIIRFPQLETVKVTRALVQLRGRVAGRLVEIRLRTRVRQDTDERYIFHVEYDPSAPELTAAELGLPGNLAAVLSWESPKTTRTEVRWLRVAFAHLGKLDVITVLDRLVAIASVPAEYEAE